MAGRILLSLAMIWWIAGCGRRQEPVIPPPAERWRPEPIAGASPSGEDEPANASHPPPTTGDDQDKPGENENEPARSIDSSQADSIGPSGARTYNTGDGDDWPSYELPLVIEIEILDFPEGITRRAEPIPDGPE